FFDWRYEDDGTPNPDFVLNQEPYDRAKILLAGRNFGCGSSREHAPWALNDFGIRVVIAPSFADIFANNCYQNGMLPVTLPEEQVDELVEKATENPGYDLTVDLEEQEVRDHEGFRASFDVDPFRRDCLLEGLDQVALTLQQEDRIREYEAATGK
ncbi:MAG: 3-isopropylmalate dehydratase small subunit, partial [Gemmatimonadota bacterium]